VPSTVLLSRESSRLVGFYVSFFEKAYTVVKYYDIKVMGIALFTYGEEIMELAIFALLLVGIILLILSFKNKRENSLETQLENFTIQLMKEIYQIKKKLKVLEDEMMINDKN
jgi:hypothetical protein